MRKAIILLVEDSEPDVALIQMALRQAHLDNPMFVVGNGDEAVAYLSGTGQYADRQLFPVPDVVLLDLYLPLKDGFEVLAWIRAQPALKTLRVLVLTASIRPSDLSRAYALGACSFLVKPLDFNNVVELSRMLQEHWLPKAERSAV